MEKLIWLFLIQLFIFGAKPPLMGFIVRPDSVDRHTLSNICNSGYYTINHVTKSIYKRAHQTSARYDADISEFEAVGLTPIYKNNFLASVCQIWENTAMKFNDLGIRTVILRNGVIIGKNGGIYQKLSPSAKLGINVSLGSGKQYLPWIDIRDLVRLYEFILSNSKISGIYNTVSSEQITMNDFSKTLLKSFDKKSIFPNAPAFIIRLLFGKMSAMLLEGSRVSNEKLKGIGFSFEFDTIEKPLLQ